MIRFHSCVFERFRRTATWNLATSQPVFRRPWWDIRRWIAW